MAELSRPHLFRYMEDPADELASLLGDPPPLRPTVPVRLSHLDRSTPTLLALVDSGSERTLAAPGLARVLNVDLSEAVQGVIGIGGGPRKAAFTSVHVELLERPFDSAAQVVAEWDVRVGFLTSWEPAWSVVMGQRGFFDQFTVTMHRSAHCLVIETWDAFDGRFGVQIDESRDDQPRFQP
jgi:hypothetical protein